MDMAPAYVRAVRPRLSKTALVFDLFHVLQLFNDKVADLWRDLYREATDQQHKDVLKRRRWLLPRNPEYSDDTHEEPKRLRDEKIGRRHTNSYEIRPEPTKRCELHLNGAERQVHMR